MLKSFLCDTSVCCSCNNELPSREHEQDDRVRWRPVDQSRKLLWFVLGRFQSETDRKRVEVDTVTQFCSRDNVLPCKTGIVESF